MTFKEILDEEIEIAFDTDNSYYLEQVKGYLLEIYPQVERASIRFANQQTQELQSKILQYRHRFIPDQPNRKEFDEHFGITNQRYGATEEDKGQC